MSSSSLFFKNILLYTGIINKNDDVPTGQRSDLKKTLSSRRLKNPKSNC